jgi:hypothetical protein
MDLRGRPAGRFRSGTFPSFFQKFYPAGKIFGKTNRLSTLLPQAKRANECRYV